MTVTKIEPVTKSKYKIYLDGQFAFVLYKGELSRYQIEEDGLLEEAQYQRIRNDIVLKRAKLRAMHLLTDMGRTESQLRSKLALGGYPEDIVGEAVEYVKSFGYIDDMEYARSFIESRKDKKSRKELYAALGQKGVEKELIEQALRNVMEMRIPGRQLRQFYRRKSMIRIRQTMRKPRKYWVIWYAKASIMKTSVK